MKGYLWLWQIRLSVGVNMDEESCQERMADLAGRPPHSVLTEADTQMGMRDHVLIVGGWVGFSHWPRGRYHASRVLSETDRSVLVESTVMDYARARAVTEFLGANSVSKCQC